MEYCRVGWRIVRHQRDGECGVDGRGRAHFDIEVMGLLCPVCQRRKRKLRAVTPAASFLGLSMEESETDTSVQMMSIS